jgi:hypothetical protein
VGSTKLEAGSWKTEDGKPETEDLGRENRSSEFRKSQKTGARS